MLLVAAVVGSGIMADRLSGGNAALALLANTAATAAALLALITAFSPISGAHFNPVVSVVEAVEKALPWRSVPVYIVAQVVGALLGVAVAHAMFGLPLYALSLHERSGGAQLFSEAVATFGLLLIIGGVSHAKPTAVPACVASYLASAYWFTGSTSFANPAVTIARAFSDTWTGIRPVDVPGFLLAQVGGAALSVFVRGLFWPRENPT